MFFECSSNSSSLSLQASLDHVSSLHCVLYQDISLLFSFEHTASRVLCRSAGVRPLVMSSSTSSWPPPVDLPSVALRWRDHSRVTTHHQTKIAMIVAIARGVPILAPSGKPECIFSARIPGSFKKFFYLLTFCLVSPAQRHLMRHPMNHMTRMLYPVSQQYP